MKTLDWNTLFGERARRIQASTIRELLKLTQRPGVLSFAGGLPAPELFPKEEAAAKAAEILREKGEVALQYGPTEGYFPLRAWVAERLGVSPEEVLITTGSQQALDLLGKVFLDEGSPVLLEAPSYMGAIQAFRAYGPRFLTVPAGEEGPDLRALEEALDQERPRFLYLIPSFQNPSGGLMPLEARRRLLEMAMERGLVVVEDDAYRELYFGESRLPSLFELAREAGYPGVIYLSSFSKVLAPGLSLSLAANPDNVLGAVTGLALEGLELEFKPLSGSGETPTHHSLSACGGAPPAGNQPNYNLTLRFVSLSAVQANQPAINALAHPLEDMAQMQIEGACEVWWVKAGIKFVPYQVQGQLNIAEANAKNNGNWLVDDAGLPAFAGKAVNNAIEVYLVDQLQSVPGESASGGGKTFGNRTRDAFVILEIGKAQNNRYLLAHELGHTMHSYFSNKHQPYPTSHYSIFVAEVASTFNEALLMDYLLKTITDEDVRLSLLGNYLDGLRGTVFRQTLFSEFELQIHQAAERGEALTGERFNDLYDTLTKRYYGHDKNVCVVDDEIKVEWAHIPHFYYRFYVYQYATSFTASVALSEQVLAGDKEATRRYLDLLSAGGSDYPIELLKKAGVDMTTSYPFELTIKKMNRVMDEIESILARKQNGRKRG